MEENLSNPTEGECFARLIEHLRKAQEECAMLSHLTGSNDHKAAARGWLAVSEQLRVTQRVVTTIAKGKFH